MAVNNKRNIIITGATLFLFAGCSASPETPPEPEEATTEASTAPAETSTTEASEDTSSDPNTLTVTIDGEAQDITFTDAYCSGPKGDIKNIIGKVDNRPPLLKVSGSHHVMLKMGNEKPYKSDVSEGLTFTDNDVTFDDVTIAGAVVDGTLACTSWD